MKLSGGLVAPTLLLLVVVAQLAAALEHPHPHPADRAGSAGSVKPIKWTRRALGVQATAATDSESAARPPAGNAPANTCTAKCPTVYEPVCGHGRVHFIECHAVCAGIGVVQPVPAVLKVGNSCPMLSADKPISELLPSELQCLSTCGPTPQDFVCGADGEVCSDACVANCTAVKVVGVHNVGDSCSTPMDVCRAQCGVATQAQVCGADGRHYGNPCSAICAGVKEVRQNANGTCKPPAALPGTPSCEEQCTAPGAAVKVCGANGKVYDSSCRATCAGVGLVKEIFDGNADGSCVY
jgi:hypothetical protein